MLASSNTIPDDTLCIVRFDLSHLDHLEEEASWFVDVTDKPELAITTDLVRNNQPITNFKVEKVKKKLEQAAEKKAQHNNPRVSMRVPAAGSTAPSLSRSETFVLLFSRSVPTLSSYSVIATLSFQPKSCILSSCYPVPALLSCFVSITSSLICNLAAGLPLPTFVSYLGTPTALSSCSLLGLAPTHLTASALNSSNEPCHMSPCAANQPIR